MSFEQLDSLRLKKFQRRVTLLSAAGTFLDGFDLTVIAVTLPLIQKQWHISPGIQGLIAASAVLGMLIGSLVLGNLTDKFGRKAMYVVDLLSFVVFAVLTAFAQDAWQLIIFRFLLGLGIGADYPISATLVSEFSSASQRGRQITTLGAMWFIGAVAAYFIGIILAPFGEQAWRYMLLVGAAFALIIFFCRTTIPESPRWLQSKGRTKEAKDVLHQISGNTVHLDNKPNTKYQIIDIFSKKLWKRTLFVCGFWFAYAVAYYGISMYTPTILKTFTNSSQISAFIGSAIISIIGVLGAVIGSYLVDVWGRRPLIIFSFAALTGTLAVLAMNPSVKINFLVILFSLAVLFANMGGGILNFVYPTELYPTSIRAGATGLATAVSRVGAILGIIVFPNLVKSLGNGPSLWFFTLISLVGLIISVWLAPETKGRNLEELNSQDDETSINPTLKAAKNL